MNVFERLASPLAHGVDFGAVARSTLKAGEPLDVEWLIAGLPPFQEHLLRAKYQLDNQSRHAAWGMWFIRLMEFRWQTDQPHIVERLTTDTLDYWISPKICKTCEGVGEVLIDSKIVSCESCSGSGRRDRKPYTIMRTLGFTRDRLHPVWIERHRTALAMLDVEEQCAAIHMLRRLKVNA